MQARLESHDPTFARENEIFQRIVASLRRGNVSIIGAFEYFDKDKSGTLNRGEFENALQQMGLYNQDQGGLTPKDIDVIIKAIDLDGDGRIQFREFERKLKRSGMRSLNKQEQLMDNIVKVLAKTGKTSEQFFGYIDKLGSGYATR